MRLYGTIRILPCLIGASIFGTVCAVLLGNGSLRAAEDGGVDVQRVDWPEEMLAVRGLYHQLNINARIYRVTNHGNKAVDWFSVSPTKDRTITYFYSIPLECGESRYYWDSATEVTVQRWGRGQPDGNADPVRRCLYLPNELTEKVVLAADSNANSGPKVDSYSIVPNKVARMLKDLEAGRLRGDVSYAAFYLAVKKTSTVMGANGYPRVDAPDIIRPFIRGLSMSPETVRSCCRFLFENASPKVVKQMARADPSVPPLLIKCFEGAYEFVTVHGFEGKREGWGRPA